VKNKYGKGYLIVFFFLEKKVIRFAKKLKNFKALVELLASLPPGL
jgi:hypothetical protein